MKYELRLKMVQHAKEHGVKPAAREFNVSPAIVRKWLRRWREANYSRASLTDRSRAPKTCPHKTSLKETRKVLKAREQCPFMGPQRLKRDFRLSPGLGAIARILRQNGLTRKRKKKYEKKRDMRAIKARYKPFEENQVDVKYLNDIPHYVAQMMRDAGLPKFQYTWREVKTGATFLGFSDELSQDKACCFAAAVAAHLKRVGFGLRDFATIQTDNGSEFSGSDRRLDRDRGFTFVVEKRVGASQRFIPPGKKNHQADVETLHHWIEEEFFNLENFADRNDFFSRISAWQLWWNTTRRNGYRGDRTPDDILLGDAPNRSPFTWLLPALDLDKLSGVRVDKMMATPGVAGGYHLPALPGYSAGDLWLIGQT